MSSPKYICLFNPHSQEWLVFDYVYGKDKYAPTYGCPISNGGTPEEAIEMARGIFGVNPETVEVA